MRRAALALLAVAAGVSCWQGFANALAHSQDFQWSPAALLLHRVDPYRAWLEGDPRIILSQTPNYAHVLYVALLPFGSLDWPTAKLSWAILTLGLGVASVFLAAQSSGTGRDTTVVCGLAFLCSAPFRNSIGNGQHALPVLFLLGGAWLGRRWPSSGLLSGLGLAKYSFAFPFVAMLALERRWRALAVSAAVLAAGWLAFSWLAGVPPAATLLEPLRVASVGVTPGIADVMSLGVVLGWPRLPVSVAGLAVAGVLTLVAYRASRGDGARLFALLSLTALVSFVHLSYDFVFLLPVLFVAVGLSGRHRWIALAGVAYFWFGTRIIWAVLHRADAPALIAANCLLCLAMYWALARGRLGLAAAGPLSLPGK